MDVLFTATSQTWVWLLFDGQRLDHKSVTDLLAKFAPSALAFIAEQDAHSQRAQQWTRDPLNRLPNGRLAITSNQRLNQSLIEAINAISGQGAYECSTLTPKAPPLAPRECYVGTLQLCCFRRLKGTSDDALASAWLDKHTQVALSTQSTEGYRQHWVNTHPPLDFDGIVEEYFPETAATSVEHFFDAVGDREKLKRHIAAMTSSTSTFLDLEQSEVVHLTDTRLQ